MKPPNLLAYPQTLIEGREYLLLEKSQNGSRAKQFVVTFVAYTSCPAIVVVQSSHGIRQRCLSECSIEVQALANYIA